MHSPFPRCTRALFEKVASLQGGWSLGSMSGGSQASDLIDLCRRELRPTAPTAGVSPRGIVPAFGKHEEEDRLSATWGAFRQLNAWTQVMVGIVLLSRLVSLLKCVRSLF